MKKISPEDEEPKSVPFRVYLKAFFLVGAILFGMFFLSQAAERQKAEKKVEKDSSLKASLKSLISKEKIQQTIDHEIRTNEAYETAVNTIESQREKVLGEASKAANVAIEKSKKTFFDYVYEYTIGFAMEKMIEQMPEEQKEKLIEKVEE